jgi:hypothetical protein
MPHPNTEKSGEIQASANTHSSMHQISHRAYWAVTQSEIQNHLRPLPGPPGTPWLTLRTRSGPRVFTPKSAPSPTNASSDSDNNIHPRTNPNELFAPSLLRGSIRLLVSKLQCWKRTRLEAPASPPGSNSLGVLGRQSDAARICQS